MLAARDPVRAFLDAHAAGAPVSLRTSGTGGARREVVRTTGSWVSSFPTVSRLTGIGEASRVWVPGPLHGSMNLFAAVHAVSSGAEVVSSPDVATHAHLTPSVLSSALARGELARAGAGLHVVVAGDRLSPQLRARAEEAGMTLSHYYGAAELSFVAWGQDDQSLRPFPGVEVVARDGELWARSPYLCSGYHGAPGPLRRDADGFGCVGDRGSIEDGFVRVAGRGDLAVTTGGATVLVAEVERVLRPLVAGELVVVGVPHPDLGTVLSAVLTDRSGFPAVRAAARRRLPDTHRPRRWFHLPELPLTEAGKLDRAALVRLLEVADRTVAALA